MIGAPPIAFFSNFFVDKMAFVTQMKRMSDFYGTVFPVLGILPVVELGKRKTTGKKPHRVQAQNWAENTTLELKRELLNFMNANELLPVNFYLTK